VVELREAELADVLPVTFANLFVGRRRQRQESFSAAADLLRHTAAYELRLPDDLSGVDAAASEVWLWFNRHREARSVSLPVPWRSPRPHPRPISA
jgi:hypothetical protein